MVSVSKTTKIVTNAIMIFLCLCCVLPFVLLVSSSLTSDAALMKDAARWRPFPVLTA